MASTPMAQQAQQENQDERTGLPDEISFDTLEWVKVGDSLQTTIPFSQVDRFLEGERLRNNGASFYNRSNTVKSNKQGKYRAVLHWCQRGPEDNSTPEVREAAAEAFRVKKEAVAAAGAAATAVPQPQQPRAHRTAKGLSIKVGCRCHFTVQVYDSTPDLATIRYQEPEHNGHECRFAPFVSEETKLWVRLMLLSSDGKYSNSELKALNENRFLGPIMCARKLRFSISLPRSLMLCECASVLYVFCFPRCVVSVPPAGIERLLRCC